jgi:pyruvate dehydrogenase E2 component (dihydrolipoamide acetyltransferase)
MGGGPIGADGKVSISNMRSAIARRLFESKTQIPHFYTEIEIDAGPLTDLREGLNAALGELPPEKGGIKFTVNDFILKASVEALRRVPGVNCSWMNDHIQRHGRVHLAFGVALEDGLVTPVIKHADSKTLRQLSTEAKELIGKARAKKLKPDEMTGSTFTVTNLGMYGVTGFYGIINPPNAAILSVGATLKKPVVDEYDRVVPGRRMMIGISGDHRVIDGAIAAQFLQALKALLETPALLLL